MTERYLLLVWLLPALTESCYLRRLDVVNDIIYGEEEESESVSEDSRDDIIRENATTWAPVAAFLLIIVGYCVHRWWRKGKERLTFQPETDPSKYPFCFVRDEQEEESMYSVVCKDHEDVLCAKGCRVDYSILNKINQSPAFKSCKSNKAKQQWVEQCFATWLADLSSEEFCPEINTTAPLQQTVNQLARSQDPIVVVRGFAFLCCGVRSKTEWREQISVDCFRLAIRAARMAEQLSQQDCFTITEASKDAPTNEEGLAEEDSKKKVQQHESSISSVDLSDHHLSDLAAEVIDDLPKTVGERAKEEGSDFVSDGELGLSEPGSISQEEECKA